MARLVLREAGTVVHVEGDLEAQYRAAGWTDVEGGDIVAVLAEGRAESVIPLPVRRSPGRPKKK